VSTDEAPGQETAITQKDLTESALGNYEKLAPVWSATTDDGPYNAHLERPMMRSLVPRPLKYQVILDLGCGSGAQCEWLLSEGADVVGIDLSPSMVEASRRRCAGRGQFFVADATEGVDLAPGSIDGVTASLVFDYFEDWTRVLTNLRLLLRPNGWIAFSDGHPSWILGSDRMNYFDTGILEDHWTKDDVTVAMRYWRRPLALAIDQIADAGFVVERIRESRPTSEAVARFPQLGDTVAQPSFIGYLLRLR
jgi:SAM-dependent methyltransferase